MVWMQDFKKSQEQWHEVKEHMDHIDWKHLTDTWATLSEVDE